MATIATCAPERVTRGDTVQFILDLPDYRPAGGWVATWSAVQSDDVARITASDNLDGRHFFAAAPTETEGWAAGLYRYQVRVVGAGASHPIESGRVEVLENFALIDAGAGLDVRSHNERVVDALRAMMEGKASVDQASLSVDGQSLSRYSFTELRELLATYEWRLRQERNQERGGRPDTHRQVRFSR